MLGIIIRICLIVGIVIGGVTYYLWLFDRAQRTPDEPLIVNAGLAGVARALLVALLEGLTWGVAILLSPFAVLGDYLGWNRRRGDRRPVLTVHGYLHNRTAWVVHGVRLRLRGWTAVYSINLWPPNAPLEQYARYVGETVERICGEMQCDRVDIVAHSMGGVVARAYIQQHGGRERVARLVTLGSPHHGTRTAPLGPYANAVAMSVGSEFLTALENDPVGLGPVEATAIYSVHDNIVMPAESGRLPDPARVEVVEGIGHASLLWSPAVFDLVYDALTREEAEEGAVVDVTGEADGAAAS